MGMTRARRCALAGCAGLALVAALAAPASADDGVGFTARDTGLYPDTTWNEMYLNAGNRGCNSCHEDMGEVMDAAHSGLEYDHPVTRNGFSTSYDATILDGCLSCHAVHTSDYGNYFADAIHSVHYSSEAFTDTFSGNCWSCHAVTESSDLTQLGDWDLVLWEQIEYDGALGGYPDTAANPVTRDFLQHIGHSSGTVTDIATSEVPAVEVSLHQDVTDLADTFTALNHMGMYDEDDLYDFSHTVTLEGVKNPTTFTYDDLQQMEQVEVTCTNQCVVAGSAGHNIYNATYTGVKLSDLVEACGGLEDGVNQVGFVAWDDWENCLVNLPVDEYLDEAVLAFTINGEPIPYDLGGPTLVVAPGLGGAFWTKWPKEVVFSQGEDPVDFVAANADQIPGDVLNYVSAAWFQNDGLEFDLGDPVELTGYAYAEATAVSPLKAIEFSCDLGSTWTRVEVPEDFDPYQWVQFDFSWTPEQAGTYVVKVRGVNADGSTNVVDGSVIVKVNGQE